MISIEERLRAAAGNAQHAFYGTTHLSVDKTASIDIANELSKYDFPDKLTEFSYIAAGIMMKMPFTTPNNNSDAPATLLRNFLVALREALRTPFAIEGMRCRQCVAQQACALGNAHKGNLCLARIYEHQAEILQGKGAWLKHVNSGLPNNLDDWACYFSTLVSDLHNKSRPLKHA